MPPLEGLRRGGEPFRVVLDTNILVASFFRGSSRQVVGLWLGGELTLCLSPAIRREYDSVLAHFAFRKEQAAAIREGLEGGSPVLVVNPVRRVEAVADDPSDDKFIECALEAGASHLISSDKALLEVGSYEGVKVFSAYAFLADLGLGPEEGGSKEASGRRSPR